MNFNEEFSAPSKFFFFSCFKSNFSFFFYCHIIKFKIQ